MRLYHGTSKNHIEAIKREGIRARAGVGADAWAKDHMTNGIIGTILSVEILDSSKNAVYLAKYIGTAKMFATVASEENKTSGIVITVELPQNEVSRLKIDPNDQSDAFVYDGIVKPEWIMSFQEVNETAQEALNESLQENLNGGTMTKEDVESINGLL